METVRGDGDSPSTTAIDVKRAVKHYGTFVAVRDLTFSVDRGEIFTLLGPNGAGKTTTIEMLEGFRSADSGSLEVLGLDPIRDAKRLRARMGIMLQEGGIYPGIRVREAVDLFRSYYQDPEEARDLMEVSGLSDSAKRKVRDLSSGNKQRLNFALALAGRPEIVFLDEPTAGMDPRGRAAIWEAVRSIKARGGTVMMTTHLLDEAEALSDRIGIVDRGLLVALGSPASLTAGSGDRLTFKTARPISVAELAAALGSGVKEVGASTYETDGPADPSMIASIAKWLAENGILLIELSSGRSSLEQVFLSLTEQE